MSGFIEIRERRVIPNFRDLATTAKLGELDDNTRKLSKDFDRAYLDMYVNNWDLKKTLAAAAELLNAATIAKENLESANNASKFILENANLASNQLLSMAEQYQRKEATLAAVVKSQTLHQHLLDAFDPRSIYKRINLQKRFVRNHPKSVISWVELSRLYSLAGNERKASQAMEVACFNAPNNRYVARSACRLFIHYGDFDKAQFFLRHNERLEVDPWLLSADISLSMIRNRHPKLIKKGMDLVHNKKVTSREITELSSTLAMFELYSDRQNRSKELFKQSLIDPNDNSLAQAQWVAGRNLNLTIPKISSSILNSYEAEFIESFRLGDWEKSLRSSILWLIDLPYSKRPALCAAYTATCLAKDFDLAKDICQIGLHTNPRNATLINNYSYILACENNPSAAEELLKTIDASTLSTTDEITIRATKGLIKFRLGLFQDGRRLYREAMDECNRQNNQYLFATALLNLMREEILIKSDSALYLINQAISNPTIRTNLDLLTQYNEIIGLAYASGQE